MSKRLGLFQRCRVFFQEFRNPAKRYNDELVGTDHMGNNYFRRPKDPSKGVIKEHRYISPSDRVVDQVEHRMKMNIPQEWNAWLRFTRIEPPTEDEIEMNTFAKAKMLQRAKELEKQDMMARQEAEEEDSQGVATTVEAEPPRKSFPAYKEFEARPGTSRTRYKPDD